MDNSLDESSNESQSLEKWPVKPVDKTWDKSWDKSWQNLKRRGISLGNAPGKKSITQKVSARFPRFPRGFREVSARFPQGFREVSARFPRGCREVFARFPRGFREVSARFPWGFREVFASKCCPKLSDFAGLLDGMSSLPACCPFTLPLSFQLERHAGGLTKRSADNFATNFPIGKICRGSNQEVCRQFCH